MPTVGAEVPGHGAVTVHLARNYGEHTAVLAGLRHASGRFVAILDDDGQNPPHEARRMFEHAWRHDFDIVYGRYEFRKHSAFRRAGSWFNDLAAGLVLDKPRGIHLSSFKVMSRMVVDELVKYDGKFPYLDGMIFRITQNVDEMAVSHLPPRRAVGLQLAEADRAVDEHVPGFLDVPAAGSCARRHTVSDRLAGPYGYGCESLERSSVGRQLAIADGVHRHFCRRTFPHARDAGRVHGQVLFASNGTPQYVVRCVQRTPSPTANCTTCRLSLSRHRRGRFTNQSGKRAMSPAEIELMASVEGKHWWYRGLRNALGRTLLEPRGGIPVHPKILDAGCGTGENLRFIKDLLNPAYAGGFDLSPVAVNYCRAKVPGADIYQSDIRDPEIRRRELDLILSCDVLSIAGLEESGAGLSRLVESIRSGGVMILNLPAYTWLRSNHDVATDTRDRVTAAQVRRLLQRLGLSVELVTYRVFSLLPAIVLRRASPRCCGRAGEPRREAPTSS